MGAHYFKLLPTPNSPADAEATLTVEGTPGAVGIVVIRKKGAPAEDRVLFFDDTGLATTNVPFGRDVVRHITLGVGDAGGEVPADLAYSLRVPGSSSFVSVPGGPTSTRFGVGTTISGRVLCGDTPASYVDVVVTETEIVSGEVRTYPLQTGSTGVWSLLVTPDENVTYSVAAVDPLIEAGSSSARPLKVRVGLSIELSEDILEPGEQLRLSGEVFPAHSNVPVIAEFRRPERGWRPGPTVESDSQGRYSTSMVLPASGIWEVRTRVLDTGDEDHAPGLNSGTLVRVRS